MSNEYTAKEIEENISEIHKKIRTATALIEALEQSAKEIETSRSGIDQCKTMFTEHREKTTRFLTDNQEQLLQMKKETKETLDHATSTLKTMIENHAHEVDSTFKTLKQTIEKHSDQTNQAIDLKARTLMDGIEKTTADLNDLVSEYRKTTRENMEILSHKNKVQSIVLFTLLFVSIIVGVLSIVIG